MSKVIQKAVLVEGRQHGQTKLFLNCLKLKTGRAEISETNGTGSIYRQALLCPGADSAPDSGRCQLGGTTRAKACREV